MKRVLDVPHPLPLTLLLMLLLLFWVTEAAGELTGEALEQRVREISDELR